MVTIWTDGTKAAANLRCTSERDVHNSVATEMKQCVLQADFELSMTLGTFCNFEGSGQRLMVD